jgi:DNA-binding IclR family transcriptional regulator
MPTDQLEQAGSEGTGTGAIVRAISYDQPDVYLTLKGLQALDFAEKDASTRPHTYRLGPRLRGK